MQPSDRVVSMLSCNLDLHCFDLRVQQIMANQVSLPFLQRQQGQSQDNQTPHPKIATIKRAPRRKKKAAGMSNDTKRKGGSKKL